MRWLKAFGVYLLVGLVVFFVIDVFYAGWEYTSLIAGVVGFVAGIVWYVQDKRKAPAPRRDEG